MTYHKAEYMPTADERRLIDRYSLFFPCNCNIGHDHEIVPYKREGLGAGSKMWLRNQTEPYVFPSKADTQGNDLPSEGLEPSTGHSEAQ